MGNGTADEDQQRAHELLKAHFEATSFEQGQINVSLCRFAKTYDKYVKKLEIKVAEEWKPVMLALDTVCRAHGIERMLGRAPTGGILHELENKLRRYAKE